MERSWKERFVNINKIIPFSPVDGPGNRTAVFFQGCNLNCLYCHNPETINSCNNCGACILECPTKAIMIEHNSISWNEEKCVNCDKCIRVCVYNSTPKILNYNSTKLLKEILRYKNFITGVTFSGGECTLQKEFIMEISQQLKKENLSCFIDTNGYIDFEKEIDFLESVDKFMLDIKAWKDEEHIKLTGKSNKTIIKNLNFLLEKDKLFEVRTVVVPDILSNEVTVKNVSEIIKNKNIRYKLIKYRENGVRKELIDSKIPTEKEMLKLKELAQKIGVKDVVII